MQTKVLVSFDGLAEDDSSLTRVSNGSSVPALRLSNSRFENGELVFDSSYASLEPKLTTSRFTIRAKLNSSKIANPSLVLSPLAVTATLRTSVIQPQVIFLNRLQVTATFASSTLPQQLSLSPFKVKCTLNPASLTTFIKTSWLWKVQAGL